MKRMDWLWLLPSALVLACGGSGAPAPAREPVVPAPTSKVSASAAAPAEPTEPVGAVTHLKGSRLSFWAPAGMRRPSRAHYLRLAEPLMVVAFGEFTTEDARAGELYLVGAKQGAELVDEKPVTRGQAHGFTGHARPQDAGLKQQVLALTSGTAAAVVTVQYAAGAEDIATKILDSVALDAEAPLDALALSGIALGDSAGFEASHAMGSPLMLTEPGVKPPFNGAPSMIIMSVPYPKPQLSDEELGGLLGHTLGEYRPDMEHAKEEELKIGACPAYSISAPGIEDGKPIVVYGFIARCPDSALVGMATLRPADAKQVMPRITRIVKSLQLDDSIFASGAATAQPTSQQLP